MNEEFYYSLPNIALLLITLPLSRIVLGQWTAMGIGVAVASSVCLAAAIFLTRAHYLIGIRSRTYLKGVLWPGLVPCLLALPLIPMGPLIFDHQSRWQQIGSLGLTGLLYGLVAVGVLATFVLEPGEVSWFKVMLSTRGLGSRTGLGLAQAPTASAVES